MLRIVERFEDVDGVRVRREGGFFDDADLPDAPDLSREEPLTATDHADGISSLTAVVVAVVIAIWVLATAAAIVMPRGGSDPCATDTMRLQRCSASGQ